MGLWVLWLTVALSFMACNRKAVYSHYEPLNQNGWGMNDTLTFNISPMKEAGSFRGCIGLRTISSYPYTGLTLIVDQRIIPSGGQGEGCVDVPVTHYTDTLNATLMDDGGNNHGTGIGTFQYIFPLRSYELNKGDSMNVKIRHFMKKGLLPGISDVGVILER